jgi:hypothetical protein
MTHLLKCVLVPKEDHPLFTYLGGLKMTKITATKICHRCGLYKPLSQYTDSFDIYCQECDRKLKIKELIEYFYQIKTHLRNICIDDLENIMSKLNYKDLYDLWSSALEVVCFLDDSNTALKEKEEKE